jgi:hypothetical protein
MSGGGSMVYPGAGVAKSTGSAWDTSYTVGTSANNLVQLNASAQLPAISAALLTNFPTLNQSTSGTAAGLTAQYIDWSASTGGASIANKPTTWPWSSLSAPAANLSLNNAAYTTDFTGTGRFSFPALSIGSTGTGGKLDIALGTLTSTVLPAINVTGTWNDAGTTHTAIKVNILDTTSAAASNLIDVGVGGGSYVSKFKVDKAGFSTFVGGQITGFGLCFGLDCNNNAGMILGSALFTFSSAGALRWSTSGANSGVYDIGFARNSASGLTLSSGATAPTGAPASKLTVAGGSQTVYDSASLGSELATSDASATGWTAPAGWACAAGVCTHTALGGTGALTFTTAHNATDVLKLTATVVRTAGTLTPTACGTALTAIALSVSPATYDAIQCTTTGVLTFTPSNDFAGSINVQTLSLKRIMGGTGTFKGQLNAQPGGTVPSWKLYRVTKTANGTRGCATANGCWEVNGVGPVAATAGLTQDIVLAPLPANWQVDNWSIKTGTACTGATTALTGLGDTENNVFFRVATYDIAAAPGVTNLTTGPTVGAGANTSAATNLVASVITTIANVDQLSPCSFDVHVAWGVKPQ